MPKYRCVSTKTKSVPLGETIIAAPLGAERILLIRDSDFNMQNRTYPRFTRGESIPLKGKLWEWEMVEHPQS